MQTVVDVGVRPDAGEPGDLAFQAPEHEPGLGLEEPARVGHGPVHGGGCEGQQQGGLVGGLEHGGRSPRGLALLVADPVDQGIHIPVAGQVGGHDPETGTAHGMAAVEVASPDDGLRLQGMADGDDRRPALQEACSQRSRDGLGSHAGDYGHVLGESCGGLVRVGRGHGLVSYAAEDPGQILLAAFACLVGVPDGLIVHLASGSYEAQAAAVVIMLVVDVSQILAGAGPAVVEEDGARGLEPWLHLLGPVAAQLGIDGGHNGCILILARLDGRRLKPQLVQEEAGSGGQHTLRAGHLGCEGIQGSGVDHGTASGTTCRGHGDRDTMALGHLLNSLVNQRVGRRHCGDGFSGQERQITATRGGTLTGVQDQAGHGGRNPARTQLPDIGDPLLNLLQLEAGGAEEVTDALTHDVGEHRAKGPIVRSHLVHQGAQVGHAGLGCTIHAGHTQLRADVHQQLVAPGGNAIGQGVGGVGLPNLLGADLGGVGQQDGDGVRCLEGQVGHLGTRRTSGRRGRSRSRILGCRRGRSRSWSRIRCRGGRSSLSRFSAGVLGRSCGLLLHCGHGIGVGQIDPALVPAQVVDAHVTLAEVGQLQGLGAQVGQGGRMAQPYLDQLLHAQAALLGSVEHDRLGLDPAHRRGELPGEQLSQQQTAQLLVVGRILVPDLGIVQSLLDAFGRNHLQDGGRELLGHLEGPCNQVGYVATLQAGVVDVLGQQGVQGVAELGHPLAQQGGVEGHVDAGHVHEGRLAARLLGPAVGVGTQVLQTGDGPGHGVLLAGQVVVDDLQEFAALLGYGLHILLDAGVAHAELVGTQGAHPVVAAPLLVTFDQGVHGGPAVEDQLQNRLQGHDPGEGAQGVVLAQGVAGEVGGPDVHAGLAQAGGLGKGHGGQGHLGELGQVEQTLRMVVGDPLGRQGVRVVTHHGQDGEPQLAAGQGIGPFPGLAGGRGLGPLVQDHALLLDPLAGIDVGGPWGAGDCRAAGDQLAVDPAGDLQDQAAMADLAHTLQADLHLVAQLDHAVHVVGPSGDLVVDALLVGGLGRVLGGGRQPHAVHQRRRQTRDRSTPPGGVDGIEVPGGTCEGGHVLGGGDGDAAQQPAGCVHRVGADAAIFGSLLGQLVAVGAATDGETLDLAGQHGSVLGGVDHMDGHHPTGG